MDRSAKQSGVLSRTRRGEGARPTSLQHRHAALFQIKTGMVVRLAFYWDRDRALADLGLEE
jgi:hypothetical protein